MDGIHSVAVAAVIAVCCAPGQVLVTPRVQETDLRKLPVSPVWKPGDPVREMPDLKRTDRPDPATLTLGQYSLRLAGNAVVIYSADGARVAGPLAFGSLWPQPAEPCGVDVEWPPEMQLDKQAGRWLISRWFQSMPDGSVPFCLAVSRSSDPVSGGWWLYSFALPVSRGDSPLEVSGEQYRLPAQSGDARAVVIFDRAAMLAGKPAGFSVSRR
jgi:hypothetical protein